MGWFVPAKVHNVNQWIISHMGVCFIPACVGIINHYELIKNYGFIIVAIILVTTFILISFVGVLAQRYLSKESKPSKTENGF
jgi:holin-like protein